MVKETTTTQFKNQAALSSSQCCQEVTKTKRRKRTQVSMKPLKHAALALAALACVSSIETVEGFGTPQSSPLHLKPANVNSESHNPNDNHRNPETALSYAPSNHPTTKTAPMVAQAFYSTYQTNRNPTKPRNHPKTAPLSNSVLSSSDTLPSFPTAHGLLSPETVIRMEMMTSSHSRDEAVDYFLRTYRREGPMACLPMLSDPKVLPRLTEAMRDIIQ